VHAGSRREDPPIGSHGFLNTETGKVTLDPGYSSPPAAFDSFSDAVDRFCALRIDRAKQGFVHAFSWVGFVGEPSNHRYIDIDMEPRIRPSRKGSNEPQ